MSVLTDAGLAFFVSFVLTAPYVAALRPRPLSYALGATGAVAGALLLELAIGTALGPFNSDLLLVVLVAPLVEEPLKLAVSAATGESYASAAGAGIGFAASENGLYFLAAWGEPTSVLVVLVIVRAITDPLLHATAATLSTAGLHGRRFGFPAAIALHALWNLTSTVAVTLEPGAAVVLVVAAAFAVFGVLWLLHRSPSLRRDLSGRHRDTSVYGRFTSTG